MSQRGLIAPLRVILLVFLAVASQTARARPPETFGEIRLLRDEWGIPHVFSDTDAGAMYGLGYATAEDRGFQMHYALRITQGRLAEVVGPRASVARPREDAVFHDRKMRTFGFYRAAKTVAANLDEDTKHLLDAYCAGINDCTSAHRDRLHPLFDKLGLDPEPWTPADCIASWWHLGQFFATDGTRELLHYRNITRPQQRPDGRGGAGPPVPNQAQPRWHDDDAAVVTRADVTDDWLDRVRAFAKQHQQRAKSPAPAEPAPKFSHAWVVGGRKTTTGSSVLVSDPQTPVRNPAIWYEFHVSGKTFNARGVGVPGSPGILVGFNENVAWGATALGADQADLFRLKTDADHPDEYFFEGRWRKMELVPETITIKGGEPEKLVLRRTHFGPVITPFAFAQPGDPDVALKRVPVCQTDRETIQALFAMMRATDAASFSTALSRWQFPSINMVFGDRRGDIGYRLLAAVPLRSPLDGHAGAAAVDGTRADMDWRGFIPHDLLPQVINPKRGWIASGNHRPVGSFYPLPLGAGTGSMGHTLRSWRLYELLTPRERFSPQDVLAVHSDSVNAARRDIVRFASHLRQTLKRELSPDAARALDHLTPWLDRGAKSDLTEPGAALAGEINTFFRFINTPLAATYGGGESGITRFLRDLAARIAADPRTPLNQDEHDFLDRTLAGAWQSANQRFGDDPARWNDRARALFTRQRLGYFDSLDGFGSLDPQHDLSMPPLDTIDGGTIRSQSGQSYTQYVPLHDVDSAMTLLPPGQSERPDAASRTSTVPLWQGALLHPAPLSRGATSRLARSAVTLSTK